jgi:hypothetical protein
VTRCSEPSAHSARTSWSRERESLRSFQLRHSVSASEEVRRWRWSWCVRVADIEKASAIVVQRAAISLSVDFRSPPVPFQASSIPVSGDAKAPSQPARATPAQRNPAAVSPRRRSAPAPAPRSRRRRAAGARTASTRTPAPRIAPRAHDAARRSREFRGGTTPTPRGRRPVKPAHPRDLPRPVPAAGRRASRASARPSGPSRSRRSRAARRAGAALQRGRARAPDHGSGAASARRRQPSKPPS